jgi:hypothetical protein
MNKRKEMLKLSVLTAVSVARQVMDDGVNAETEEIDASE